MRENMTFLTNYYQIREMTIDRMKEIIDQNKNAKEGGTVFFGDSITQFMDIEKYFPEIENKYNCGIGGITSTMLLHFIDEGVLKFQFFSEQYSYFLILSPRYNPDTCKTASLPCYYTDDCLFIFRRFQTQKPYYYIA